MALEFLPAVSYPFSPLPAIAQPFAMLIPTTHAAQLAKYYFGLIQIPASELVIGWAYLLGFAALMGFLASRRAHPGDPSGADPPTPGGTRAPLRTPPRHRAPAPHRAPADAPRADSKPAVNAPLRHPAR